jgi:hypothetical protein
LRATARLWDYKRMRVEKVLQVPNALGSMDARFSGRRGLFFLNNGNGQWWVVTPFAFT